MIGVCPFSVGTCHCSALGLLLCLHEEIGGLVVERFLDVKLHWKQGKSGLGLTSVRVVQEPIFRVRVDWQSRMNR